MQQSAVDREFRLGLWKIHILHHAAAHEVYGLWLLEELAEHGHRLSPGTLYPLLARMKAHGWLRETGSSPGRKARRSYRITAEGRRVLELLRRDVAELYREVVLGEEAGAHAPPPRPDKKPAKTRT
jgi:PadR family transcriptional regulator, regulatory protein PadR